VTVTYWESGIMMEPSLAVGRGRAERKLRSFSVFQVTRFTHFLLQLQYSCEKKKSLMVSTQTEERKSRSGEWYDKRALWVQGICTGTAPLLYQNIYI